MIDAPKVALDAHDLRDGRRRGHAVLKLALAVFAAGVAVKWSWSTVAEELFHGPAMRYSDAFSIVLALVLVALAVGAALRMGMAEASR